MHMFSKLELQTIAHPHMFSRLELYRIAHLSCIKGVSYKQHLSWLKQHIMTATSTYTPHHDNMWLNDINTNIHTLLIYKIGASFAINQLDR